MHRRPVGLRAKSRFDDSRFSSRVAPLLREIVTSGSLISNDGASERDKGERLEGSFSSSLHGPSFKRMQIEGMYMRSASINDNSSSPRTSSRSTARLPARAVTVRLLKARTPEELLACLRQHEDDASGISIAAGLTHLTKLCERFALVNQLRKGEREAVESALLLASSIMLREVKAVPQQTRGLANVIWASAKLANIISSSSSTSFQRSSSTDERIVTIARHLASELASALANHPQANEANGFDLSNSAYGLASLGLRDHPVWMGLLIPQSISLAKLRLMEPQPLSNIVWALGKLEIKLKGKGSNPLPALLAHALRLINAEVKQPKPSLLPKPKHSLIKHNPSPAIDMVQMKRSALTRAKAASEFSQDIVPNAIIPQFLSNICWAMGRLGYRDEVFLKAAANLFLSKEASSILPPNTQNISSICWAFATLEQPCPALFSQLKNKVQTLAESRKLGTQALSNLCWSYAKASAYDPKLFTSLSEACLAAIPRFNSQDLVNVAWAFAYSSHRDKPLMAAISRAVLPMLPRLDPIEISQLLWSMASLNFSSERVCNAVSELAERQLAGQQAVDLDVDRSATFRPQRRVEAGSSDDEDISGPCDSSTQRRWQLQALTNTCWSFAVMRPHDSRLFKACYGAVWRLVEQGGPRGRLETRSARQLYQAHLAHQLAWHSLSASLKGQSIEPPTGFTDSPAEMDPKLLDMCKRSWISNVSRGIHSSNSQMMIQVGLEKMGYRCKSEYVLNQLLSVDILLHHPRGIDLVVEVDGPQHFASDGSPMGEHHLRNRLIRSLGYPLLCIKVVEWSELEEGKRQEFLRDKVEETICQELESTVSVHAAPEIEKRRFHRSRVRQRSSLEGRREGLDGGTRAPRVKNSNA